MIIIIINAGTLTFVKEMKKLILLIYTFTVSGQNLNYRSLNFCRKEYQTFVGKSNNSNILNYYQVFITLAFIRFRRIFI